MSWKKKKSGSRAINFPRKSVHHVKNKNEKLGIVLTGNDPWGLRSEARRALNKARSPRIICPECRGNGYIKIPHEVYADQFNIQQCETCSSQGEIDDEV